MQWNIKKFVWFWSIWHDFNTYFTHFIWMCRALRSKKFQTTLILAIDANSALSRENETQIVKIRHSALPYFSFFHSCYLQRIFFCSDVKGWPAGFLVKLTGEYNIKGLNWKKIVLSLLPNPSFWVKKKGTIQLINSKSQYRT